MSDPQSSISIAIPTYNRCETLIEALASIRNQSMSDFECFVVDNGPSTDQTETRVRKLAGEDRRFKYVKTGSPGCVVARNIGFRLGSAPLLMTIDDDVELPDKSTLSYVVDSFREDPRLGVMGLSEYYPDGKGRGQAVPRETQARGNAFLKDTTAFAPGMINRWGYIGTKLYHLPFGRIHDVDHVRSSAMAVRRQAFDQAGGFFEPYTAMGIGYRYETDLCVRAKRAGWKIVYSAREPQAFHKAAERSKGWSRGDWSRDYLLYTNRNNTFFFLSNYWSPATSWVFFLWDLLTGSSTQPGLWRLLCDRRFSADQVLVSMRGKFLGWRMYWKHRRSGA